MVSKHEGCVLHAGSVPFGLAWHEGVLLPILMPHLLAWQAKVHLMGWLQCM